MNALSTIKPIAWIKIALYGLLLLSVYYSTLTWLVTKDWTREAYSYGYLIPFVVLYLLWDKRRDLVSHPSIPSWKGLALFVFGLIFFWVGELSGEFLSLYISFWLVLVGLCWMHLGWQKLKTIAFALAFILTMFPLPHFILNKVTLKLRLISSQLGVAMMQLCGMPVYREGNIIDVGFTQLQVVDACSGLHSLISLMVLCLLLVYFFQAHFWKRAVLLISAVPLAVFANSIRITLTGILYKVWGPKIAEGFFRGFSGWLIFVFCIPVLLLEMKILEKLPPVVSSTSDPGEAQGSKPKAQSNEDKVQIPWLNARFVVVVILLTATLAISRGIEFRERIPITKPLNQFPLQVGEWSAEVRQTMDKIFIDELDLSDYAIIDYQNSLGRQVNFYVAYYESQSKGKSIHSPETCLPGSGWIFKQAGAVSIPCSSGDKRSIYVNRAFMEKDGHKQLVYYWFPQRGRILTNAYQLKIYAFWDALTKHRTDGALVRLIAPVHESEGLEEAEARLQKFTRDIVPVLEEYLPK
ncbi:MAG: VPLPA-CTERM-specific exosortase XrtD [Deltaproteobacteria bacterium]|nr:VPLPA-CTERM-specific exosortase XrtD [Deltaproteobacteria bacterium]